MNNFIKIIKSIVKAETAFSEFTRAKVTEVDETNYTAMVVDTADDDAEYEVVLCSISGSDNGIIPIPVVGSIVMIGFADRVPEQAFISKFSKIEKFILSANTEIEFQCKGHSIKFSSDGIEYIDSKGEPMVLGQSLFDYLSKLDTTVQSILTWAATGSPPNPSGLYGGIAPLAGVTHTPVSNNILSQKGKLS